MFAVVTSDSVFVVPFNIVGTGTSPEALLTDFYSITGLPVSEGTHLTRIRKMWDGC
jgi:hypothetical protein